MSPLRYPGRLTRETARRLKALAGTPYADAPLKELEVSERALLPALRQAAEGDFEPFLEAMARLVHDRQRRGVRMVELHRAWRSVVAALPAGGWTEAELQRLCEAYDRGEELMLAAFEEEMERRLSTDYLTGLANRRGFMTRLEAELKRAKRYGRIFSVALLDVDDLKPINDALGHQAGDSVLEMLGETLRTACREADLAARIGGDEFGCIFTETEPEGAATAMRRAGAHFSEVVRERLGREVAISWGLAEWRRGEDSDGLLARADNALYTMKRGTDSP